MKLNNYVLNKSYLFLYNVNYIYKINTMITMIDSK